MRELLAELGSYDERSRFKESAKGVEESAKGVMVSGVRASFCHPERAPLGAPVEGRPSEVEARETPVLTWTETIEWSSTATELILHS